MACFSHSLPALSLGGGGKFSFLVCEGMATKFISAFPNERGGLVQYADGSWRNPPMTETQLLIEAVNMLAERIDQIEALLPGCE